MTFLTFQPTDILHSNFGFFATLDILMVALERFQIVIIITKTGYFRLPMTIDTPTHGQWRILFDHRHFFHLSMTALTFDLTDHRVLSVIKVNMVRHIMDANPFYWAL